MTELSQKLRALTSTILDEDVPVYTLRPLILEVLEVFRLVAGGQFTQRHDIVEGENWTSEGLAVSPVMAAMCVEDYARTVVFIRGVHEAVIAAGDTAGGRPVKVLYAGCGPFGTLVVPLLSVFGPEVCQFVFADISEEALESARQTVEGLGFEESVVDYVLGDVLNYEVSSSWVPDVIVSETMQACLKAEPQVAIFRHLFRQAPRALFVPEEISIELKFVDLVREIAFEGENESRDRVEVGAVFRLNRDSLASWRSLEGGTLPAAEVQLPTCELGNKQPKLFTRIQTFGKHVLSDYASGLTSPRELEIEKGDLSAGESLRFLYRLGESPALVCEVIAGDKVATAGAESGESIEFPRVWKELARMGQQNWLSALRAQVSRQYSGEGHGDLPRWRAVLKELQRFEGLGYELRDGRLHFLTQADAGELKEVLMKLSPWRKGPFEFGELFVDTEWRSDWKWERLREKISPVNGRRILDVGCGNGYHLWRMLDEGASLALGIDPSMLFGCQFLAARHFGGEDLPLGVLPLGIEDLPAKLGCFDSTFSMGVLYHRKSPVEHLEALRDTLVKGGELVLETLVVEGDENTVLLPEGRYAQMRNVWFLPSVELLSRMMKRVGFREVEVLDVSVTTVEEQRGTEWMKFQSLPEFLDPTDHRKTIEGYPGPLRAVLRGIR
ncbi:tRNA 5-methoxyuridine(34)/uridine 5-oxyacetic acid(34) synthase CmoB [Roseibacillus persicicus]|nr:tRNA 5-methoxyuridine(34)/uridine 5-oxyacetic acid(34) synthase CmoB [Roseibacillus persicicus]MDQ8190161.1 tRNA 5-methoxyuridine(34)/uridine 5-oxyacetic acid(34) synthase CmoB [Roseibacillus persicicus]